MLEEFSKSEVLKEREQKQALGLKQKEIDDLIQ